jgi:hypothetical protein
MNSSDLLEGLRWWSWSASEADGEGVHAVCAEAGQPDGFHRLPGLQRHVGGEQRSTPPTHPGGDTRYT